MRHVAARVGTNDLKNFVAQHTDARFVWLSIGAEDVYVDFQSCRVLATLGTCVSQSVNRVHDPGFPCGDTAMRPRKCFSLQIRGNIKRILDPLFASRPSITVIQFGYGEWVLDGSSTF